VSGLRAGVIGGSIAGLTAALLLRDLGHSVDVFERSPQALEGLGAGIIVHEPSVRYFVQRSAISLDDISITSERLQYLAPDGSIRHEQPSDYRFTAWNSLFRGLESLFDRQRYHRAHTLVGIDQDVDGVDLRFAEGAEHRFDLVVCADGVSSVGRRRLFGVEPAYSGYVGWRGICGEDELSAGTWATLDEKFTYALIEGEHVVAYPIPTTGNEVHVTGRRVNFTWYRNVPAGADYDELMTDRTGIPRPISVPAGLVQDRHVERLRADAARLLPGPIAELVIAARDPFITAIVDADCQALRAGRVCLIGDAAITARPHAAAGSAKAAADAWDLAAHLEGADSAGVVAVLADWERDALARGRALLRRTRDMGTRLQGKGWVPTDPSNRFGIDVPTAPVAS
jgi:2,6-dihydroxypyridine 3-monooxygenase